MLTPTQILALVSSLGDCRDVSDGVAALRLSASFADVESMAQWRALEAAPGPNLTQVVINVAGTDVPLGQADQFLAGRRYQFSLLKTQIPTEIRVFFAASVTSALLAASSGRRLRVAELKDDQAFTSRGGAVDPWMDNQVLPDFVSEGVLIDPSKRVFDLSDSRLVPTDLRPWLLAQGPRSESEVFASWKVEASVRIWASLVDQVSGNVGTRRYRLSGPPAIELDLQGDVIADAFWPLHTAAEWVFVENSDQDARRLLLAIELAHALRVSQLSLSEAVPVALESAKAAYRAHIQSASRDTLKALADLRRAVIEETQKTVQRTQELAGSLWRDLLIAASPFVLKLLPDTSKISSEFVAKAFLCVAAIYLFGSFLVTTLVNRDYFSEQQRAREAWRDSLLRYLPQAEVASISDRPVKAAKKVYDRVLIAVGIFYLVLIVTLLFAMLGR